MNLAQIADEGNDLETLKQLRHKIAETIDESNSGRDIAALSRQLQIVMQQITVLEAEKKEAETDIIADLIKSKTSQQVRNSKGRLPSDPIDDEDEEE